MDKHESRNSRLDFKRSENFLRDLRPEACQFFRAHGHRHLVEEVWEPLLLQSKTIAAVAIDERPWPPKGVGAKSIHGIAHAVLSDDGQAIATPAILHPSDVANLGLAAGLTKFFLEELRDAQVKHFSYFIDPSAKIITTLLNEVGFVAGGAKVVIQGSEFVNFSTSPDNLLGRLDLADMKLGDVLLLRAEPGRLTKWAAFHFALEAGLRPYWDDRLSWTVVFPGIIDWVALPPGMITGTREPRPVDPGPLAT